MRIYYSGNAKIAHVNQQSIKIGVCTENTDVEKLRRRASNDDLSVRVEPGKDDRGAPVYVLYGTPTSLTKSKKMEARQC